MIKHKQNYVIVFKILIDICLIQVGYVLAFYIRYLGEFPVANFPSYLKMIPWISILAFALFFAYGLYNTVYKRWIEIFSSILWVVALVFAGNTALSFMLRQFAFPRTVLVMTAVIHVIFLTGWRYWLWKFEKKMYGHKKVIIIGRLDEALVVAKKVEQSSSELCKIVGILVQGYPRSKENLRLPYIVGDISNLDLGIKNMNPDTVFICPGLPHEDKLNVIKYCLENHYDVNIIPDFYEILIAQAKVYQVYDMPVFYIHRSLLTTFDRFIKRIMDIVIAVIVFVITSPLMLMVSIFIKIDSIGPVFLKQERVGENGQLFFLYKFRTMVDNAEIDTGPVLSNENDVRITRVGKYLRYTRMDELPQLLNVIKGEMSIIGPRPERPYFVEQFNNSIQGYNYRHMLRGGITGLAQVSGKYSTSAEDKLRFDLLYAKNYSPLVDIQILLNTLKVLLIKDKAS